MAGGPPKTGQKAVQSKVVRAGTVRITDKVLVDVAQPHQVTLAAGQPLVIEVPYELHETSDDKETYLFSLQCTVGESGTSRSPTYRPAVVDQWDDRRGRQDDRVGALRDQITLPKGDHSIGFTIEATYSRSDWGKARLNDRKSGRAQGTLHVHVA